MILAINVNASLDRVFIIERFLPDTHMRSPRAQNFIGGKGLNTAMVLQTLGAPILAISFMAGRNGEIVNELLKQSQLPCELIWLPGETREANIIIETSLNRHSHITTFGYDLTQDDCNLLLRKIQELSAQSDWAVMAGSLPKGAPQDFYAEIISLLHRQGVKTLIDSSGILMLKAIEASPEIVKMNQLEFQETFNVEVQGTEDWISACEFQRQRLNLQTLVITCGKDGILALTPDGIFQAGCSQEIKEVNAAGAGDAVSAALVYYRSLGKTWEEALAWAIATSAAVVLTEGTAVCHMQDILSIYPHAWVKKISIA